MNATFERLFRPYPSAAEAVLEWERLRGGERPAEAARRLAVSLILREDARRAVEASAGQQSPSPGFGVQMSRLADRTRVTPLLYLADSDPDVAAFLVDHPHAAEALLEEEGDGPPEEPWAFAARLPDGPHEFLQGVRWVAPLLLEGCGIDRRHAEEFLHHLHAPEVFGPLCERLLAGRDVRSELTALAAEFRRTLAPAAVAPEGKPVEVDVVELIVQRFGEALRLVKAIGAALEPVRALGAGVVRTRGAARAAPVTVPIQGRGVEVVVTVRPAPAAEFGVTLDVRSREAHEWEVRWSAEEAPEGAARAGGWSGTGSVRLPAGRYDFACVSAAGEEGPRFRLVLEGAG
jgi:hypothetical protein